LIDLSTEEEKHRFAEPGKQEVEAVFLDENGKLTVIILSEEYESQRYKMWFQQKHGMTSLVNWISIGEYTSHDLDMVPGRFFRKAINQARGIFSDRRKKEKKAQ